MMRMMIVLGIVVLAAASALATTPPTGTAEPNIDKRVVEDNLLVGLASENAGLRRSAALMLAEFGTGRAAIRLMAVLRSSDDAQLRIAAAYALSRIDDPFGRYFVKMTGILGDEAVKAHCAWYYNTNVRPGTFLISEAAPITPSVSYSWMGVPFVE